MKSNVLAGENTYAKMGGWFDPAKRWVKTTRKMTFMSAWYAAAYEKSTRQIGCDPPVVIVRKYLVPQRQGLLCERASRPSLMD